MQKVEKKKNENKKKIQFLCPTSININLTLQGFVIVMRLNFFVVKFNDRGICRTSKMSKTELLVKMFQKLLTNLTKSST